MLQKAPNLHESFPLLKAFESNPFQATVDYYAACLSDKAIAFIESKLHLSRVEAATARIGISDRSLGNQLPGNGVRAGKLIRSRLETLELYKANGREALRGYVTIPLFDASGTMTGIEGLRLDSKAQIPERIVIGNGARLQESGLRLQEESRGQTQNVEKPPADSSTNTLALSANKSECLHASGTSNDDAQPTMTAEQGTASNHEPRTKHQEPTTSILPLASSLPSPGCSITSDSITIARGDRTYVIRGLERNMSSLSLKVSLAVSR
ncbi:MAG: hypothetical protein ABL921_33405, partial [Pirellula sp.]